MKKVGLVTIFDNMNFGNRLQNYALQHVLETEFDAKVVTRAADHQMRFMIIVKAVALSVLSKFPFGITRSVTDLRWDAFRSFTKRYIKTKVFWGMDKIPQWINDKFDVFIAGSDQIWNWRLPVVRSHAEDYFLCFADSEKRNSYSASFGVDFVEEEWAEFYRMQLGMFQNLSVREEAGKRIISELINKTASLNIDPTLLLTQKEWKKIEKKPKCFKNGQPYMLTYFLGGDRKKMDSIAPSKKLVQVDLLNETSDAYISGPSEFIYWIRHADFVCTDSFHATVFSIIFCRPFIVVSRPGMNSRIETLLKSLGLEDRFIELEEMKEFDYGKPCDYQYAYKVIAREKRRSIDYLKRLLEKTQEE